MKGKVKIFRITTVPLSLHLLLDGQVRFLKNKGYEVLMISADGKERKLVMEKEKSEHSIMPFTRYISPLTDLFALLKLVILIAKKKPLIIHTHTPKAGLLGMLAGKICGVQLKIHTIAGLPLMTATGRKRQLLELTERLTYWAADYVLPNSQSIMNFIRQRKFTSESKLDMIGGGSSNGINLERFSKKAIQENSLELIKETINYNSMNKYILSVGRVVKDKGIIELVDAFLKVKETIPNLKLLVVGPLEEQRKEELLPKYISEALLTHKDIFHIDWSDEVEYYMYLADIFIHASYREGFPNVLLQSGAMECPIICSDIYGNIDIVKNKSTGLYFNVGKADHLAKQLIYALNNKEEMDIYTKRLRKQIETQFSQSQIHDELFQFYQNKLDHF